MESNYTEHWEKVLTTVYLENIRMLFDCMQELNYRYRQDRGEMQRYTGYDGSGGLIHRRKIQAELQTCIRTITENCLTSEAKFLHQNPLHSYLAFCQRLFLSDREATKRTVLAETMAQELSPMLNYFNILQYLTEEGFAPEREKADHHAALPYFYEDLCLSIREMTACHACFLLYREEGELTELISRSGYVADGECGRLSNFGIKISELDNIIVQSSGGKNGVPKPVDAPFFTKETDIAEGIWTVRNTKKGDSDEKDHTYLVMELPYFREGQKGKNNQNFYLLLDYKEAAGSEFAEGKGKTAALKVLFLRNRLWEALRQDYAELIDRRFDCSYIKSMGQGEPSCIMHITDIHMNDNNSWDAGNPMCTNLCAHIDKEREKHIREKNPIDLLAVTGDLVHASQQASEAQTKYHRAGKLLQEIATHLWGDPCGANGERIVPHDWKRRIMVVPGNHDYTAMSDVVVETGGRRIKNALPAGYSGGTMSKFTYYIEFLINFLDAPTDELLENDLNEIRSYKNLNLKVAMLNTSSRANSLQNNKVEINQEKVSRLIQRVSWQSGDEDWIHVVLMHHSPFYQIDYFEDKYEPQKYCKGTMYDVYKNYRILLEKLVNGELSSKSLSDEDAICLQSIREEMPKPHDSKFSKSEIKSDMNSLVEILSADQKDWDEFNYNFLSKSKTLLEIQNRDRIKFTETCREIIHSDCQTTVLAGHEHKEKYWYEDQISVYMAARLYNPGLAGNENLVYLVVTPGKNDTASSAQIHMIPLSADAPETGTCPCSDGNSDLKICTRACQFRQTIDVS